MFWNDLKDYIKEKGYIGLLIVLVSIAFVAFHLYTGYFGSLESFYQRSIHLLMGLLIAYLVVLKEAKSKLDIIISLLGLIGAILSIGYIFVNADWVMYQRFIYVSPLSTAELILGVFLILIVLDVTRRRVGTVLVYVVLAFLIYPFIGPYLPGPLYTRSIPFETLIDLSYLAGSGIFGIPLGVSATILALFIIFGSFITTTGAGNLLYDFSSALVGKSKGGPAKIAVVASALMGSVSGSPTANVVTTGSMTIPMMKRLGYKSDFAGAVEASASTCGQFLPPVMGAGAFIMVVFTNIPYVQIMGFAIIPALLFVFSIFVTVHIESIKMDLAIIKTTENVKDVLGRYGHMLFPIGVLVYMLVGGYSPAMSGALCTVLLIIVSFLKKTTRPSLFDILNAFETAARNAVVVISATASAGIVVSIIYYTQVGDRLASNLVALGADNLFLILILVAIISIILGMGMPPVPAYIVQIGLTVPAMLAVGVPIHVAHLFVFYFCGLSLITPPVAVASYAAAALSSGNPMKTGWTALRISLPSFIIPFMFVLNPAMIMDGPIISVILVTITALFGILALASSLCRFMIIKLNIYEVLIGLVAAILLILPLYATILPGLVALAFIIASQLVRKKKESELI